MDWDKIVQVKDTAVVDIQLLHFDTNNRLCCTTRLMFGVPLSPDGLIPRPL
ncbi:hypothetical protein CLV78_1096 [Aliiruegeria haliotis]|uniref:Uncharacterized protein n=1 Tax=Aliiruegeria haliotis TaxID=1280846 RepID=A0A2T0RJM7_9RHOB|nr:hypothetical protein CLV78_1096 [Aliiruegeria haliotis]